MEKKVKLTSDGSRIAHIDFNDQAIYFSRYLVLDKVDRLTFQDLENIIKTIKKHQRQAMSNPNKPVVAERKII